MVRLRPGIALLPFGPNGEKWGVDDWGAKREWDIGDFNACIYPMHEVFEVETGEFIAEKNGLIPGARTSSSSSTLASENDEEVLAAQLPTLTVAEFLSEEPESYDWLVEGIAAKGAVTKFAGKAKESGKTTFLMCMTADVLTGTPFIGRATKKARTLYLSEQGSNLREALADAGLDDVNVEGLELLTAHRVAHLDWKELMRLCRAYCVVRNIDLLIIDTLVDFSDVEQDEENSSGKVKGTIKPLKTLAQSQKVGVIFTQHHNLEGRGRGSTQFEADPDILIDLYAPDQVSGDLDHNMRQIRAIGRGVDYRQLIKFTKENGYEACDQSDETFTSLDRSAKTVLRFLPMFEAEARSVNELVAALEEAGRKLSAATVERALKNLIAVNLAEKKKGDGRGAPFKYWRVEPIRAKLENEVVEKITDVTLSSSSFSDTRVDDDEEVRDNVIPLRPKTEVEKPRAPSPVEDLGNRWRGYVHTEERLKECHEWAKRCADVDIDIETKGKNKKESTLYTKATIRLIALHHGDETWYLDCDHLPDAAVAEVLREFQDKPKYFHNSTFDVPRIYRRFGVLLNKNVKDALIATRAARAGEWEEVKNGKKTQRPDKSKELQDCIKRELGVTVPKNKKYQKGAAWFGELSDDHLAYAGDDIRHLKPLYEKLMERIEDLGIKAAYDAIGSVVHVFLEASVAGIPFDAKALEDIQTEVAKERDEYEGILRSLAEEHAPHPEGKEWVWRNSDKDVSPEGKGRAGMHRMLRLVGVKLNDLEEQTLLDNLDAHPLVKALYDYRVTANKYSKYRRILTDFYENGRMYPQVKIAGAVTGRVLYADTNIQGFDKKKTDKYRKCVRAEDGHVIVKGDFAQQELRIAAWWSEDEKLLAAFANGEDVYMNVAEKIVGKPVKRGTEEGENARAAAKRAVLGYLYGLGPAKYRRNAYKDTGTEISEEEAKRDREAFRAAYPGFYEWQKKYGAHKDETNLPKPDMWETRSVRGWRRVVAGQYQFLPDWKKEKGVKAKWIPKYTDRLNGPIQSTAGDILYLTLGKLAADLENGMYEGACFLFTAHDEVVLHCPEGIAEDVAAWLKSRMIEAFEEVLGAELGGPKSVEVGFGPSWGEIKEVA